MPVIVLLAGLDLIAIVLWVVAFVGAVAIIMAYIAGVLHGLPFPINQLAGPVADLGHGLNSLQRKILGTADRVVGGTWHALAAYFDKLWHHLEWSSMLFVGYGETLWHAVEHLHVLRHLVNALVGGAHSAASAVKTLEKEWHGIEHRVKTLERDIAKGIGHDLRIRIKALEQDVKGLSDNVIPGLRAGVKTAEGEVADLRQWLGLNSSTKFKDWAAGLVVAGLAALGLAGLVAKCNPLRGNENPCGWWNDLSALLGLATATLAALEFEELIKEMQAVEHDVTVAAKDVFGIG